MLFTLTLICLCSTCIILLIAFISILEMNLLSFKLSAVITKFGSIFENCFEIAGGPYFEIVF